LTENQRRRIAGAYKAAGISSVDGFRKVLLGVMSCDDDRCRFE
jgi:hypothetical protein